MANKIRDLAIYESLTVVTIEGYEPKQEWATDEATGVEHNVTPSVDLPGDANWLCEQYGMAPDDFEDTQEPGILWSDYDCPSDRPWLFSVLIASDEVDALKAIAEEAGYSLVGTREITEPDKYGDGHTGTVEILAHREGWVILG